MRQRHRASPALYLFIGALCGVACASIATADSSDAHAGAAEVQRGSQSCISSQNIARPNIPGLAVANGTERMGCPAP